MKHAPINPDSVYSREEAAELLGVSLSTVKRLIASGQLVAGNPDISMARDRLLDNYRSSTRWQYR